MVIWVRTLTGLINSACPERINLASWLGSRITHKPWPLGPRCLAEPRPPKALRSTISWRGWHEGLVNLPLSLAKNWKTALRVAFLLTASVATSNLRAQSIHYFEREKLWLLSTDRSSYALAVGAHGELQHIYWGPLLPNGTDLASPGTLRDISSVDPYQMLLNEEYPGWGGPLYEEPALKLTR